MEEGGGGRTRFSSAPDARSVLPFTWKHPTEFISG